MKKILLSLIFLAMIQIYCFGAFSTDILTVTNYGKINKLSIGKTSIPTQALDVSGNAKISGTVTANLFIGSFTGTITTANLALNSQKLNNQTAAFFQNANNLNAGTITPNRLSGYYPISVSTANHAPTQNHNQLLGLQGGIINTYYHSNQPINTTSSVQFNNVTANNVINNYSEIAGQIKIGNTDAFGRNQIWNYKPNSILRLGALASDGDIVSTCSEGIVIYGKNVQSDPIDSDNFGYARLKPNRFGLYNSKLGGYVGYLFKADTITNEFYVKDNAGVDSLNLDRAVGNLTIRNKISSNKAEFSSTVTTNALIASDNVQVNLNGVISLGGTQNNAWRFKINGNNLEIQYYNGVNWITADTKTRNL